MFRYLAALVATAALLGQDSPFEAQSKLVLVPVTVVDAKGRHVFGLEASEFSVFDNGKPQKATVDTIDTGIAPIALIIAVQSSGISSPVLEKVQKIGALVQPLITGDRGCVGLVSFAGKVNWLQHCTKDHDAFQRALNELRPVEHKEGRLLDAAVAAIQHLRLQAGRRRVLLLISESRDRSSETNLESAAMAAQSAGVTIYAATYSAIKTAFTSKLPVSEAHAPQRPRTPKDDMGTVNGMPPNGANPRIAPPEQRVDLLAGMGELLRLHKTNTTEILAKATGGTTFPFTKQRALEEAIQKLGGELHSQYLLSFVPEAPAPGFHVIEVQTTRPGIFLIRARPGYWATGGLAAQPK